MGQTSNPRLYYNWLSFHRVWEQLSQEVTGAIAQSLQPLKVEPNAEIYRQGLKPVGLYLLKWGSVEIYRLSLVGKTHITYRNAGEVFGYVPLLPVLLVIAARVYLPLLGVWMSPPFCKALPLLSALAFSIYPLTRSWCRVCP